MPDRNNAADLMGIMKFHMERAAHERALAARGPAFDQLKQLYGIPQMPPAIAPQPQMPAPPPGAMSPGGGNPMAQGGASVMAPPAPSQQQPMGPPGGGMPPPPMAQARQPQPAMPPQIPPFKPLPGSPLSGMQPSQPGQVPPPPSAAPTQPSVHEPQSLPLGKIIKNLTESGVSSSKAMDMLDALTPAMNAQNKQELDFFKANNQALKAANDAYAKVMTAMARQTSAETGVKAEERREDQGQQRIDIMARNSERRRAELVEAAKPLDQATVDYYAKQSLAGDNSWQVGLARGKVGQKLISAVKDRIPKLAAEQQLTPEDASARKGQRDALNAALRDRTKYVATGRQFVRNFTKQADLVEKYLEPGAAGSLPVFNKWIQAGRKGIGDPDVVALDTAIRGLAREHQRIVTGVTSNAQLHVAAQETADELLNRAMTPEQVRATLQVMREEAQNAVESGQDEVGLLTTQLQHMGDKKTPGNLPGGEPKAPKEALDYLTAHPETAQQFSAKYGYLPAGVRGGQ